MAKLELLYGSDPRLRRLAQGMVVEQSQEIALMQSISPTDRRCIARVSIHKEGDSYGYA
jgi:hypothetical protein